MVNLTRIYTRTGDDGTTNLGDMSRTGKNDPRLKAYADVDEANSSIGLAVAAGQLRDDIATVLIAVQNDLFDVGADLCRPVIDNPTDAPLRVTDAYVARLEAACDTFNSELDALRSFILPGGTVGAAHLHVDVQNLGDLLLGGILVRDRKAGRTGHEPESLGHRAAPEVRDARPDADPVEPDDVERLVEEDATLLPDEERLLRGESLAQRIAQQALVLVRHPIEVGCPCGGHVAEHASILAELKIGRASCRERV